MTTVYGVTFIGAREQIERQLRDVHDMPRESVWIAASYLAKKVSFAFTHTPFVAEYWACSRYWTALETCSTALLKSSTG